MGIALAIAITAAVLFAAQATHISAQKQDLKIHILTLEEEIENLQRTAARQDLKYETLVLNKIDCEKRNRHLRSILSDEDSPDHYSYKEHVAGALHIVRGEN